MSDSKNYNTSFARGLDVIRAFDARNPRLTVAGVADRTGLDRAVARRLLLTLVEEGYARQDGKLFELSSKVLTLGYSYLSAMSLDQRLQPNLDALSKDLGQAVSVSVLDGAETIFIARSDQAGQVMAYVVRTGLRLSAFTSASGRVLLSGLAPEEVARRLEQAQVVALTPYTKTDPEQILTEIARVRAAGHCVNEQELEEGLLSVSVPVRGVDGRIVAALNTNCNHARALSTGFVDTALPALHRVAAEIAALIP
ncbi:IclR family transcriptional regulator C-terminal domain-containing protein [Pararhodobacter sp. CCB-MM2]|uniref:IclR family transcriptional regulator domain-containing protein n=1 Tax=Pararhodobacter sp. CCB-MM2 TaxID=1786003 RepID=UPI00082F1308|nr:IclR family transcriptional regulator C-terminal domain-containing protein [Pararhodobacter sp. CCB-MM2]